MVLSEEGGRNDRDTGGRDPSERKPDASAEEKAARELARLTCEQGLSLTGPEGLLKQLTKTVLETALAEEMTEHLGYEKHDPACAGADHVRNGTRAKTVLTEAAGHVQIDVPRDRAGTFEPQIVRKRQRRLSGVDEICAFVVRQWFDNGRDLGTLRGDARCVGVSGDGQPAHRQGRGGAERVVAPAAQRHLRRGVHRRDRSFGVRPRDSIATRATPMLAWCSTAARTT